MVRTHVNGPFVFPVRDEHGALTGLLAVQDARNVLFEPGLRDLVVARDLMRPPTVVHPDTSLYDALMLFVETDLGQLPVVAPDKPDTVLGLLDRRHVFTAYSSTLAAIKAAD